MDFLIQKQIIRVLVISLQLTTWHVVFGQELIVRNDVTNVSEDVSVKIPVLHNDYAFPGDPLNSSTLIIERQPQNGKVQVVMDLGFILYRPDPDFAGIDSFSYSICTFAGVCQEGNVNVHVHGINDGPVANLDLDSVLEDEIKVIEVVRNDFDIDDFTLNRHIVQIVQQPRFGAGLVTGQQIEYRPKQNFHGNDVLKYELCDGQLCDTAFVKITVIPVNDPPTAIDDRDSTIQNLLLVIDPLANDIDSTDIVGLDQRTLQLHGLLQASHGETFADTTVGLIVYIPEEDFVGADSFSYRICDLGPNPILCDTAMIYIWVESERRMASEIISGEVLQEYVYVLSRLTSVGAQRSEQSRIRSAGQKVSQNQLFPGSYRYSYSDGEVRLFKLK